MAQGAAKKIKKRKPSVLKRIRQAARREAVNRANLTRVRTAIKKLRIEIAGGDAGKAQAMLRPTLSAIDRAVGKGVLKENAGNRYKSRLALAVNALQKG
jgi:small subunit ribosomal protein S20